VHCCNLDAEEPDQATGYTVLFRCDCGCVIMLDRRQRPRSPAAWGSIKGRNKVELDSFDAVDPGFVWSGDLYGYLPQRLYRQEERSCTS
jgi:hypothetical protein